MGKFQTRALGLQSLKDCLNSKPQGLHKANWTGAGKVQTHCCVPSLHISIKLASQRQRLQKGQACAVTVPGCVVCLENTARRPFSASYLRSSESCPPSHLLSLEPNLDIVTLFFNSHEVAHIHEIFLFSFFFH